MDSADDFSGFDDSLQMFAWASAPPSQIVRHYIESGVENMMPGCRVDRIVCDEAPRYLSGWKDEDAEDRILSRMGAVFKTVIYYTPPNSDEQGTASGVATLICQNLHDPENIAIGHTFDLNGDIDELEQALPVRIYEEE